jgi:GntR family transcriptional regulator
MTTWERSHNQSEDAWAASIRDQGGEPSTAVSVHIEQATPDVAKALGVEAGDQVAVRRRIRSVDGEPHQLADSFFPFWLAQEYPIFLQPGDLSAPGGLLASVGLPQARCVDEITARMPTPEETRLLDATRGVPLIVHTRTGYDKQDRPVRHMITRMTSDRVHVRYELDL